MKERVIVAMSGGVDSSVAAALLKKEGYDVIGITMKTWGFMEVGGAPKYESGCCSLDAIYDAKNVADFLGFPHYTVDFTKSFEDAVINNFIEEYTHGRTPNPCVVCNRKIKWEELLRKADSLDAEFVATGHYADIEFNTDSGRYCLKNSQDSNKDQTYALWGLTQDSLKRTLLPLGKYNKTEVRKLAGELKLKTAQKPDSQEICFVADNNYERFLRDKMPDISNRIPEGDILFNGKKIGKHKGIPFYTVGQRKGLGIAVGKPVYITKINHSDNTIEIGEKEQLLQRELIAEEVNFISQAEIPHKEELICKIRYSDKGSSVIVKNADSKSFHIEFNTPKSAITPGQSAVLYDKKGYLIAGGIISRGM